MEWLLGFLAAQATGAAVWIITLGNRVSLAEQRHVDLKELILTQLVAIDARLSRIERGMNGHLKD